MDISIKITIVLILFCIAVESSVINSYDDDACILDKSLVEEIASYKDVTKNIMDDIRTGGSGEKMYQEYVKFIDKFGARPAGTANLENAIDYMINLTRQNDLNDVTTEELEVPHFERLHESAKMLQPQSKRIALLTLGSSVNTPPEGITAEVIVINNFEDLEKTDRKYIEGKIVVFDKHFTTYGKTVKIRNQGASKAARKGAIAVLIRSVTPFSIYSPHAGYQYYEQNVTKIPAASITIEDADLMRRLQDEGEKIVVQIKMSSTLDKKVSRNTLIDLRGSLKPENIVIVSGHIDSWDIGQGAIDDGSGMFISWFIPVLLNQRHLQPRRTIRSILWTAEENGLVGAEAYLKTHENELANINFIMESDEGTYNPLGLDVLASPRGRCIVKEIMKLFVPINKMYNTGSPGSDMTVFTRKGVPGASLTTQAEKYFWFHHTEGDTLNVQSMSDLIECATFWTAFTYVIADISIDIPR